MKLEKTKTIVNQHKNEHAPAKPPLIPILQDIQDEYGWLDPDALLMVSELLAVPVVELHGIATFYTSFRLQPPGKYKVAVCTGTACHVKGAPRVLSELERKLGISADETTPDEMFSLETVRCVGCCALAPVVTINEDYHQIQSTKEAHKLIDQLDKSEKVNQNE